MKWWKKLLRAAEKAIPSSFLQRKLDIASNIDPDRIYVENVRSLFGVPKRVARAVCDIAVEDGGFRRRYAVQCPNPDCGRVIQTFSSKEEIPEEICCDICEIDENERYCFRRDEVRVRVYYQLIEQPAAA